MPVIINGTTGISGVDGSAGTPAFQGSDANTGIRFGSDIVSLVTGGSDRLYIDSSGRLGVGTTSPSNTLHVVGTGRFNVSGANNAVLSSDGGDPFLYTEQAAGLKFGTNSAVRMTINSSGSVGIGVTGPSQKLHIADSSAAFTRYESGSFDAYVGQRSSGILEIAQAQAGNITLLTNGSERARIDSSGRLLIGTSSGAGNNYLQIQGDVGSSAGTGAISLRRGVAPSGMGEGAFMGIIDFGPNDGGVGARIAGVADAQQGTNDYPGRLVFSTTADGASSPTERMRITNVGNTIIGKAGLSESYTNPGISLFAVGNADLTRSGAYVLALNRQTNDGNIIEFYQDNNLEGTVSVSGTTVSYNGAHISRWSQLPGGSERTEILRGTVMSNIDEMCDWGEEENEQLNRMKISDVEGDINVAGVFQAWDDDDDTYTNDFYCAMTGDFIIRIAAGTPVHRGQLLMSAGDGTAKPQGDGFVQDKTIAKVTSNHVTCTYPDGSYCVPCVLMAC